MWKDKARLWNIATFLASGLFSALVSYGVTVISDDRRAVLDYRSRQFANFLDSTTQFNTFASAFSCDLMENKPSINTSRKELIENLNQQFAQIDRIETLVPKNSEQPLMSDYKDALSTMIDKVHNTDDTLKMRDFWSTASKLLVARKKLAPGLHGAI
jgi:hypothetical protein